MLKGTTWQFNATLEFGTNPPPTGTQLSNENGLFTCDSVTYNEIRFDVQLGSTTIESISYVTADLQSVTVYTVSTSTWTNNKYKTIAFINELDTMEETAETQFVQWLKTHAVKTADTNEYLVTGTDLISVANAIRNKSGDTYAFDFPSVYSARVASLVTATDLELTQHTKNDVYVSIPNQTVAYHDSITHTSIIPLEGYPVGKVTRSITAINIPTTLSRSLTYQKSGSNLAVTATFTNDSVTKGVMLSDAGFSWNITYYTE